MMKSDLLNVLELESSLNDFQFNLMLEKHFFKQKNSVKTFFSKKRKNERKSNIIRIHK